eukprot:1137810-Pelagomonas_calceolata.AAC.7
MASLGFAKVDDMVGRADMLEMDSEVINSSPKVSLRCKLSLSVHDESRLLRYLTSLVSVLHARALELAALLAARLWML